MFFEFLLNHLETIKDIALIMVCVLLGQLTQNRFNGNSKHDLKGIDLVLATLLLSALISFGLRRVQYEEVRYVTGLVFGLSGAKLIKSWIRGEIWKRFDFLNKGNKKN